MKTKVKLSLIVLSFLCLASLRFTQSTASSPATELGAASRAARERVSIFMPVTTTLDVDRTDDDASASACTGAANDCSLRGAIIKANADLTANSFVINLQAGTTYNLTLTNATQENAAATGDLDITTTLHSVTIVGGGSSGPNATIIDAAGLNTGSVRDRVFHITGAGVTVTLQDLVVTNGTAADDGTNGTSTNPANQTTHRAGGGILNSGGNLTLTNVKVESCQAVGRGDSNANFPGILDGRGGGLASTGGGTVAIADSIFTNDAATGGAGPDINNGQGSNAKGGAIYFDGGTLNVSGSQILSSTATGGYGGDAPGNQQNGGFGGFAQGGGAYIAAGTVTINTSTFESCVATGGNSGKGQNGSEPAGEANAGGLYSLGNVTVSNSTFDLNSANGGNGGDAFGPDCFGSHEGGDGGAGRGGAIMADGGSAIIDTSTFASNTALGGNGGNGGKNNGGSCGLATHGAGGVAYGGAITNNTATLNIRHATISLNNAQAGNTGVDTPGVSLPPRNAAEGTGGGIRVAFGAATIENTIIAGNTAANGAGANPSAFTPAPDVAGSVTSNGHNLLGDTTGATGFTGTGDLTGANPMLAALADNGGPTQTMMPQAGSQAIDAGVAAGATTDQRGRPRTYDDPAVANAATSDATDIGAVEAEPDCTLTCPGNVVASNDAGECGAVVNYDAPDGAGCGTITCDHLSGSFFDVGTTTVTCTSTAGPTCSFTVTVNDTEPPVITTSGPKTLWPPNHKYVTFNVGDLVSSVSDNCDSSIGISSVHITRVTSDEPNNSGGDGNTTNDIVIAADCKSVQLRAERMGGKNGRVYTITLSVTDSAGNTGAATVQVTVPHSQNGSPAVDDGPQYTVVSGCH
jgi:hypothetical protein